MMAKSNSSESSKNHKYDCAHDIYAAMAENTIYKDYLGDGGFHIASAYNLVMDLYTLEKFVKAALAITEPAYQVTRHKNETSKPIPLTLGKMLGSNFQPLRNMPDRQTFESEICGYRLSPNVILYFETLPSEGFWFTCPYLSVHNGKLEAEYFNDFIDELRKNSKDLAYKEEIKGRRKQAADNHRSLTKYIKSLLDKDHYARLMVVRLNLAYANDDKNLVSIDVARAHREKFLANRYHNKIFENVVGYAWGLQYCVGKGGYFNHFFMFLDCDTQPDNSWYTSISDYWLSITDGKGRCQNCDKGVLDYIYPGVGLVNRSQADGFIERAASFLTMKELFFSLKHGSGEGKFRAFDKGKVPRKFHLYGIQKQN